MERWPTNEGEGGSRALQRLWLSLLRGPWRSLAVVPADPVTSAREATSGLVDVVRDYRLGPIRLVDAEGASPSEAARITSETVSAVEDRLRTVIGLSSLFENPSGIPIAVACEAVLLLLRYGETPLEAASATIDLVGSERVIGCITLRGAPPPPAEDAAVGAVLFPARDDDRSDR